LIITDSKVFWVHPETLILWSDASGLDLALSFQDVNGCEEMWDQIAEIQERMAVDMHGIVSIT
jgi:protein phosphatase-4 regulatory subunit 3